MGRWCITRFYKSIFSCKKQERCHTRFQKETRCTSDVHQNQVYTHMKDVINEYIKDNAQKRKQKRVLNIITSE